MKPRTGLNQTMIVSLVALVLAALCVFLFIAQRVDEARTLVFPGGQQKQWEISKLAAEVRQIRSDTSGSLFWLKAIALFVTVGGGIGGYLFGQTHSTRVRLRFDESQRVDSAYQAIIQELAHDTALRRAAAATRLGALLQAFPAEWEVSAARRSQMIRLTKQTLAAALALEENPKVRKSLTIAIALDRPSQGERQLPADLRELDLSGAHAQDAYWARVDLSRADLYGTDLTRASLRNSSLCEAQLRETSLGEAILVGANCAKANFKLTDLRGADLTGADLSDASFERAQVDQHTIRGARWDMTAPPHGTVEVHSDSAGTRLVKVVDWLDERAEITTS